MCIFRLLVFFLFRVLVKDIVDAKYMLIYETIQMISSDLGSSHKHVDLRAIQMIYDHQNLYYHSSLVIYLLVTNEEKQNF